MTGRRLAIAAALLWSLGFVVAQVTFSQPLVDEVLHRNFIKAVASNTESLALAREQLLPMIPGYHYVLGTVARFSGTNIRRLRVVSFLWALLLIPALFYATSLDDARRQRARVVSVLTIPFLPVMGWLVYTDLAALLFCVLAFGAWRREQRGLAGVALVLATLIRQNCALLGLAFVVLDALEARRRDGRFTLAGVMQGAPMLLGFLPVAGLLLSISDVVVTRTHVSPRSIHLTQVWFFLLLQGIVLLPALIRSAPSSIQVARNPFVLASAIAVSGLYWVTARADHPWNLSLMKSGSLMDGDDWLMDLWLANPLGKILGLVVCLATMVFIVSDARRARRPEVPLILLGTSLLMLIPSWLLCVRYDLLPMTIFALTATQAGRESPIEQWWSVGLMLGVTGLFLGNVAFW